MNGTQESRVEEGRKYSNDESGFKQIETSLGRDMWLAAQNLVYLTGCPHIMI